uniref:Uncharacterized protein n=1 Tax=Odontella aurita TaxID=265563 RepID=A0A6U6GC83_9STRA|mmetsp:Transcript_39073/g.117454  ORF Transcript_39073/g.117454 Transcript_39073/m.117454 type:complete len:139 (+) Transcript_39073:506-922(+)
MNHATTAATEMPARIGTNRIAGEPSKPPSTLDRNDVGSTVAADTAVEGKAWKRCSSAKDGGTADSDDTVLGAVVIGRVAANDGDGANATAVSATARSAIDRATRARRGLDKQRTISFHCWCVTASVAQTCRSKNEVLI